MSLIGLAFISVGEEKLKQIIFVMVSLAVGGLFGDCFHSRIAGVLRKARLQTETSLCSGRHFCTLYFGDISSLAA